MNIKKTAVYWLSLYEQFLLFDGTWAEPGPD